MRPAGKATDKPLILVVDDERQNLQLVRRILMRRYAVELAESGQEALSKLDEIDAPAVVLTDMRMPGMNGAELLAACVDRVPEAKRLLMTGYSDYSALMDAVNRGKIHATVQKPFEPSLLQATVDSVVSLVLLERQNARLLGDLEESNEQLRAANKMLEKSLEERGANLLRRMQDALAVQAMLRKVRERDVATELLTDLSFARRLEAELCQARAHGEPVALIVVELRALEHHLRDSQSVLAQGALAAAGAAVRQTLEAETLRRPAIAGRVGATRLAVAFPARAASEAAAFAERLAGALGDGRFGAEVSVLALDSKPDWCTWDAVRDLTGASTMQPGGPRPEGATEEGRPR